MTETGAAFKQWNLHAALQFIGSQPEVAVYVGCMPTNSKNNILIDWKSAWNRVIFHLVLLITLINKNDVK